jgi:hypothetical protein
MSVVSEIVSEKRYDGYRWQNSTHCRFLEEPEYIQYTPAKDGVWVKTIYRDGRVEWGTRPAVQAGGSGNKEIEDDDDES